MRRLKKTLIYLMAMVLCSGIFMVPVLGAVQEQDGMEVTLRTDKESYEKGEQIKATLEVTNKNSAGVSNVLLESLIPDGYKLADGAEATKQIEFLKAGETVSLEVTYIANSDQNKDDNNTGDTNKPGDDSKSDEVNGSGSGTSDDTNKKNNNSNGDKKNNKTSTGNTVSKAEQSKSLKAVNTKTGDNSHIAFWAGIMVIAAIGIIVILILKKKKGKQFLSLLLCFTMAASIFAGNVSSVKAAETTKEKELQIAENVTVDSSEVTIHAVVKYTLQYSEPDEEKLCTITFDANDGTTPDAYAKVVSGSAIGTLPELTREGYTFLGWYTEKDGGVQVTTSTVITEDLTIYAHWNVTENGNGTYRITFDKNDGSAGVYQVQMVNMGDTVSRPAEPTRELYRFTGWYMESAAVTEYDFDTPVTGDLTLYAGWGNPDGSDDGLYAASNDTETIFSISDIYVEENEVTVTYNTNNVALMNVEFFEDQMEDGEWNEENLNYNLSLDPSTVASGYTESYGELVTITLPVTEELPEYYLVRASMVDSESNYTEYVTAKYTETYARFNAETVEDFDPELVINFDDDNSTNFGVIKDSVIVIPTTCQYNNGQEFQVEDIENENETDDAEMEDLVPDHLFTFPDKNAVISTDQDGTEFRMSDLKAGNVIYVEGTTWMFKIKSIEKNENGSISFTQDKNVTLEDFYDVLKVDFKGKKPESSDVMPLLDVIGVNETGSVTFGPANIEKEFLNGTWKISGSIPITVTGNVTLLYDVHLFSKNYFEASFKFETNVTGEIKAEVSINNDPTKEEREKSILKYEIPTPKLKFLTTVVGLEIYVKPEAKINWELSGDVSLKWNNKQISGFEYNSVTGRTDIKEKENTVAVMVKGSAEAKFGPAVDIGISFLDSVLSGGIKVEGGVKATAEAQKGIGSEDFLDNIESKHACALCVSGRADWYVSADVKCSYKISDILKGDIVKVPILDVTEPITFDVFLPGQFFVSLGNSVDSPYGGSPHFGGGECINKIYRTEFKVQDEDGNDIKEIPVSVLRQGKDESEKETGKSPYVVYLYRGTYKVSAEMENADISRTIVVNNSKQTVILSGTSRDTILEGFVVDAKDQSQAISGALVKISSGSGIVASAETDRDGKFRTAVPSGLLNVEISKENYIPFESYETIYESDMVHFMEKVELIPGSGMGGFHGTLRDAVTNEMLEDVTLNIYNGWNNPAEPDTSIGTIKTDSNGEFRYNTAMKFGEVQGLPCGNYTLTASKAGYSDTSYNIIVYPGTTDENPEINETMSPGMNGDSYRIVLTWGLDPWDLDSHLVADTDVGQRIHVYYGDKEPEPLYANLDVDDTDSEGPETITITNFEGLSNIRYAVHDYTNRDETGSYALSNSGAVVRVYKGEQLLRTFPVPTGYSGTEWDVFSLKADGSIETINTMNDTEDPYDVLGEVRTYGNEKEVVAPLKDYELEENMDRGIEAGETESESNTDEEDVTN